MNRVSNMTPVNQQTLEELKDSQKLVQSLLKEIEERIKAIEDGKIKEPVHVIYFMDL